MDNNTTTTTLARNQGREYAAQDLAVLATDNAALRTQLAAAESMNGRLRAGLEQLRKENDYAKRQYQDGLDCVPFCNLSSAVEAALALTADAATYADTAARVKQYTEMMDKLVEMVAVAEKGDRQ